MDNFAFLLPFFMTIFGVLFLLARMWSGVSATRWGLAFLSAATAFCVPLFGFLPIPVQAILANILFVTAFFLYGEALLVRFGKPLSRKLRLSIAGTGLATIGFAILGLQDLRTEIIFADTTCALLIGLPVLRVLRSPSRLIDRLLVCICGVVTAETVIRVSLFALLTSSGDEASLGSYLESTYAFYAQLGASVIAFLMALTILGTVVSDVIDRHADIADRDTLTLLLNRRGFGKRVTGSGLGAVVIGDIDHFKTINDRFGHATGDAVIATFARLLERHLPERSVIARFGGEEFVAFVPGYSAADAAAVVEEMRQSLASHDWELPADDHQITASFGVTAAVKSDVDMRDAIARADAYLYEAKRNGRNRTVSEVQKHNPHIKLVRSAF